jgi:hypothetical protein
VVYEKWKFSHRSIYGSQSEIGLQERDFFDERYLTAAWNGDWLQAFSSWYQPPEGFEVVDPSLL